MGAGVSLPDTMVAMVLTGHGGLDQLSYRTDYPLPHVGPDDVLIEVGAAGVNNTDINTRIGWYAQTSQTGQDGAWTGEAMAFPRIQGADVCGVIVMVGGRVDPARIGQRVLVHPCMQATSTGAQDQWLGSERDGGFAQFVSAPSAHSYAIDCALSDVELASFPCSYGTAENLLTRANVTPGERVLITGASGGLGSAAVQLAKRRGAEVLAVVSRAKMDACAVLGADLMIPRDADLEDLIVPGSVDVVIDGVGGANWPGLLDLLKPKGRYAVSGAIAGPWVDLDLRKLYLKDLTLYGCTSQAPSVFRALVDYIGRGEVRPIIAEVYPLKDMARAQSDFLTKRHIGKMVVVPPTRP